MKTMTWKTKLIIAAIGNCFSIRQVVVIVSAMSFGSLLLALTSFVVGAACGWYAKNIYDKYFKDK